VITSTVSRGALGVAKFRISSQSRNHMGRVVSSGLRALLLMQYSSNGFVPSDVFQTSQIDAITSPRL